MLSLLAVLLIVLLCCAWERFDNSNGDAPGLADGRGIAAVSVLLYWTGWNSTANFSRWDCDLWMSPQGSRTSRSVCGHGYVCAAAGIPLKGLWPKDKATLEKVCLNASAAVDKSMLQQVHLQALVAVHEVMLEHLKVCGHG